jgi:hypothetical protein
LKQTSLFASPISVTKATKLCRQILALDKRVLHVSIVDPLGGVISDALANKLAEEARKMRPSEDMQAKYGSLIAVISNIFKQGEETFGKPNYMVSSYNKLKVLIFPVKTEHVVIVVSILPDADETRILQKVSRDIANTT